MEFGVSPATTRRTVLAKGVGGILSFSLAGCVTAPDGPSDADRRVRLIDHDDRPDIPASPSVEILTAKPSASDPARLRVTVTNDSNAAIQVGEERAIVFAYVHSVAQPGLVLLPVDGSDYPAVRPGCWRLTDSIAIAEYYGVVDLQPGESIDRTVGVWADPEVSSNCLPTGTYRFETTYRGGPDVETVGEPEWDAIWGFDLRVE